MTTTVLDTGCDIDGAMREVFTGITSIVHVETVEPCWVLSRSLLKDRYQQFATLPHCCKRRKRVLSEAAWETVDNIGQPMLYDHEGILAQCAHVLCYAHLLVFDVLGDSNESEALRRAADLLHICVPLGLRIKGQMQEQKLVVYLF